MVYISKPWTNTRFPFDIRPSNLIHKEKESVYHWLLLFVFKTVLTMTHIWTAASKGLSVSSGALCNLCYWTIWAPSPHFLSLDVSRQGAEGRNSVRTFRTIFNASRYVITKVPCVQGIEHDAVQPVLADYIIKVTPACGSLYGGYNWCHNLRLHETWWIRIVALARQWSDF